MTQGTRLLIALGLNAALTAMEAIGGLWSGSLLLLGDAAHNGSDALSLAISYFAWRISQRPANEHYTFGYGRAETVAALVNLTTLFVIALLLIQEAVNRLLSPSGIDTGIMLAIGAVALIEDLVSAYVLWGGKGLNIRSALIHMIGDTLATAGVIAGALIIMVWQTGWVDPLLTAAVAVYLVIHSSIEIRKAIPVLMDAAPDGLDLQELVNAVTAIRGVEDIHHLHLWRMNEETVALEAHAAVRYASIEEMNAARDTIKNVLKDRFGIEHVTLELENPSDMDHPRPLVEGHKS